ncbi:SDR family NAD(P)-dependent oxidoreductase [Hymenobacter sp. HMF4947]|uniref:SDR family NAD(P)-dependent oxidoreductase n=1 Tax=Hymenobacter ginkgonis TaxID=2682976 RepID=A0A7K1TII9_9BACT|nr:SDR family NAD(P)-dependent oxidoreductase [Hymenobacter ginkgonis]MVN78205.1 SDR family NAD(P)-dependent oxidoreductase [Hymenobacter ginkgonis]
MHYYFLTGASQGLGRALAEAILQRADTQVIGISRHSTIVHPRYQHHSLDLSDLEAVRHNVAKLFPAYPFAQSLTLINNAGTLGQIGYTGEVPNEHFQFVFDLNVTAPAILMNTFLRAYGDQTHVGRTLLNISSGAAQRPIDGWAAYSASKAALNALSETTQKEQTLRGSGVRVWALSPGVIDTAMQAHIRTADAQQFSEHEKFAAFYAEGQLQAPATVAASIASWLALAGQLPEQVVIRLPDLPGK